MPSCKTPQGLKTHAPNSPPPSPQPATPNRTSRSRPPHTHPCRVVSHSTLSTARHRPIGRGRCLFGGEITHEKNTIRRQFCRRTCYIGFCTRRCTQMELKKKKKECVQMQYVHSSQTLQVPMGLLPIGESTSLLPAKSAT